MENASKLVKMQTFSKKLSKTLFFHPNCTHSSSLLSKIEQKLASMGFQGGSAGDQHAMAMANGAKPNASSRSVSFCDKHKLFVSKRIIKIQSPER